MQTRIRVIALALASSFMLWGQANANKAQLSGTVSDPNGAVVPNAAVKIRNVDTGLVRDLKTNDEGQFIAVQLDPGTYEVVAESSGFAATTLKDVALNVGGAVTI
ncbi:MAG TPA: carboxypeptidase-like regulatory domain-containing protein, partial [Bryobacteraceae bacterium]